jgi:hypothetical protein
MFAMQMARSYGAEVRSGDCTRESHFIRSTKLRKHFESSAEERSREEDHHHVRLRVKLSHRVALGAAPRITSAE